MADDIDIRGGGVVSVDTATLRDAAVRFAGVVGELDEIAVLVGSVGGQLFALGSQGWDAANRVEALRTRVRAAAEHGRALDSGLRAAAAVYEAVELLAERAVAEAAGEVDGVRMLDARLNVLAGEYPEAMASAALRGRMRGVMWPAELTEQAVRGPLWLMPGLGAAAGALTFGFWQSIGASGAGTVARDARLSPTDEQVRVRAIAPPAPVIAGGPPNLPTAPPSLAAAAQRIPGGGDARVRVEKYTMPDGTHQFAVYVAGTQSVGAGGREAFDMSSNLQLYGGTRSASYAATVAALTESGARPGDVVHAFGHSQGAMIAAHLALEGGYDTKTLVTFGSPVEADVGPDTLSVSLRHTDDPIGALEGGGHTYPVGAPGSFVAERVADPAPGAHDVRLPAHGIVGYAETAQSLDASSDPRMAPVRALFDELGAAASVEVVEYSVERLPNALAPSPGPSP